MADDNLFERKDDTVLIIEKETPTATPMVVQLNKTILSKVEIEEDLWEKLPQFRGTSAVSETYKSTSESMQPTAPSTNSRRISPPTMKRIS